MVNQAGALSDLKDGPALKIVEDIRRRLKQRLVHWVTGTLIRGNDEGNLRFAGVLLGYRDSSADPSTDSSTDSSSSSSYDQDEDTVTSFVSGFFLTDLLIDFFFMHFSILSILYCSLFWI